MKKIINKIFPNLLFRIYNPRPSILEMKKKNKFDIIAIEVGTYKGQNAENIMKNLKIKKLYCIDPYKDYENNDLISTPELEFAEREAKGKLFKYGDKVIFINKFSDKAFNIFEDESIDYIYLDGNHYYEGVLNDLRNYYPKLKKGGIIAGHDIENKPPYADVVKALITFCYENNLYFIVKSPDWIFEKK